MWRFRYLFRSQFILFNHYFFYHLRRNSWTDNEQATLKGLDRIFMKVKQLYIKYLATL